MSGSKLALPTIFRIIHCWATGIPAHSLVNLILNASKISIYTYTWYKTTWRNIVHAKMMCNWWNFMWKKKYNRGKHFSQTWLFGISQPSQHKYLIMPVSKRGQSTLMNIIFKHVNQKSNIKIVSDGWAAYRVLEMAVVNMDNRQWLFTKTSLRTLKAITPTQLNPYGPSWRTGFHQCTAWTMSISIRTFQSLLSVLIKL